MPNYQVGEQYTAEELSEIGLYDVVAVQNGDLVRVGQVVDFVELKMWRVGFPAHKVTVGEGRTVPFEDLEHVRPGSNVTGVRFEVEHDAPTNASGFQFFDDLSFGFHVQNQAYDWQFSDKEFGAFVRYVNWLDAQRKAGE